MDRAVSYSIAVALGAIGMTLIGYFVFVAPGRGISFEYWLASWPWAWPALGAMMGFAWWHMLRISR